MNKIVSLALIFLLSSPAYAAKPKAKNISYTTLSSSAISCNAAPKAKVSCVFNSGVSEKLSVKWAAAANGKKISVSGSGNRASVSMKKISSFTINVTAIAKLSDKKTKTKSERHYLASTQYPLPPGSFPENPDPNDQPPVSSNPGTVSVAVAGINGDEGASATIVATTNISSAEISSAVFNYGDGSALSTGTTLSRQHVYADNGTYMVTVTITTRSGSHGAANGVATISNVSPTSKISGPFAGNSNSSLGFFATSTDPSSVDSATGLTYSWSFGDGGVSTLKNPVHSYSSPGSYSITLSTRDKDGGLSSVVAQNVAITNPPPIGTMIQTSFDKVPNFGELPTIFTVKSGNWSDPTTWSTGALPSNSDVVRIDHAVSYDLVSDARPTVVAISSGATLDFRTDIPTRLRVTTLQVLPGGVLKIGDSDQPVNGNVKAEIIFNNVPFTAQELLRDPTQFGHGLVNLGTVTIHGAAKSSSYQRVTSELLANSSVINLVNPLSGVKVGDMIVVADTEQRVYPYDMVNASLRGVPYIIKTERRNISAISPDGRQVTLSTPLTYKHPCARDVDAARTPRFCPTIGVLSRNVVLKSESANGTRAYTIHIGEAAADIRFAQFSSMGRTTLDPYDATTFSGNGSIAHLGTNQPDRNSVTFLNMYGPGVSSTTGYQFHFTDNSVFCGLSTYPMPFIWGINADNAADGYIARNNVHNWGGAGISLTSGGSRRNLVEHNSVTQTSGLMSRQDTRGYSASYAYGGDGKLKSMAGTGNVGVYGDAIWAANPENMINENFISDAYKGIVLFPSAGYHQFGPKFLGANCSISGECESINLNATPILQMKGNEIVQTIQGFDLWNIGNYGGPLLADPNMEESLIENSVGWHIYGSFFSTYEDYRLHFKGVVAIWEKDILDEYRCALGEAFLHRDYHLTDSTYEDMEIIGAFKGLDLTAPSNNSINTIKNSTFKTYIMAEIPTAWTGTAEGATVGVARHFIFDNVKHIPLDIPRRCSDFGQRYPAPYYIAMFGEYWTKNNLRDEDTVVVKNYQGNSGDDFQVFYPEQSANHVMQANVGLDYPGSLGLKVLGSPIAGLTNQQLFQTFGFAQAGQITPCTLTRSNILGFTCQTPLVSSQNHPPIISLMRNGSIHLHVGEAFTIQLQAVDPDGDPLTFRAAPDIYTGLSSLPPGATLDPVSGVLSWTPQTMDPYRISVVADDGEYYSGTSTDFYIDP